MAQPGSGVVGWDFVLEKILDVAHSQCLSVIKPALACFLLAGSEGKLTVVAQKMSVLSGEDPRRKAASLVEEISSRLNEKDLYLNL